MNSPIFIVGDRVRMRNPALYASNTHGTVTTVFRTARGYYDVKFDAALELRGLDHGLLLDYGRGASGKPPL